MNRADLIAAIRTAATKLAEDYIHGKFHVHTDPGGRWTVTVKAKDLWVDFSRDASDKALFAAQEAIVAAGGTAEIKRAGSVLLLVAKAA